MELNGMYRLVGLAETGKVGIFYDLETDETAWVNLVDQPNHVERVIPELYIGNIVRATMTGERDRNGFGDFVDLELVQDDETIYYAITDEPAPGPIDEIWEKKPDDEYVSSAARRDQETGEVIYEIQIQQQEIIDEGEEIDVFVALQRGDLLTEPMFQGTGTDYLESAQIIFIVNPINEPYIVMYIFAEDNDAFDSIYASLYEYIYP